MNSNSEGDSDASGETFPIMPHVHLSVEELAVRHPSMLAPPEEPLHDVQLDDDDDAVHVHGCKVAAFIQGEMDRHSHRRHYATRQGQALLCTSATPFGATSANLPHFCLRFLTRRSRAVAATSPPLAAPASK